MVNIINSWPNKWLHDENNVINENGFYWMLSLYFVQFWTSQQIVDTVSCERERDARHFLMPNGMNILVFLDTSTRRSTFDCGFIWCVQFCSQYSLQEANFIAVDYLLCSFSFCGVAVLSEWLTYYFPYRLRIVLMPLPLLKY